MKFDLWTYRAVILTLAFTVIGCLIGSVCLTVTGHELPDLLTGLGTGALGALAGVLAPAPPKLRS